jgi:hypothetical protein
LPVVADAVGGTAGETVYPEIPMGELAGMVTLWQLLGLLLFHIPVAKLKPFAE